MMHVSSSLFLSMIGAALAHLPLVRSASIVGSVCDVSKYAGGSSSGSDIGAAIQLAFASCGRSGNTLVIPRGNYSLTTRVVLSNFRDLTIQWDGDVTLGSGLGSDAWFQMNRASDFVLKGTGSFSGRGVAYRESNGITEHNPRLIRCYDCSNFEISGVTLHDAPSYHLVVRGRNGYLHDFDITSPTNPRVGTTDGVDLMCDTCLVERVNVDNGDDSIVMKSPVHNVMVRDCTFRHGNGAAIGSNGNGGHWDISNVTFLRISLFDVIGAAYMKSYNHGSGSVRDITWSDIKVSNAAYTVAVNQQWCGHAGCNGGNEPMAFYKCAEGSCLRYSGWSGTSDSSSRPVISLQCNEESPCYGVTFESFSVTKPSGTLTTSIKNACGSGLNALPACPSNWQMKLTTLLSAAHATPASRASTARVLRGGE